MFPALVQRDTIHLANFGNSTTTETLGTVYQANSEAFTPINCVTDRPNGVVFALKTYGLPVCSEHFKHLAQNGD